MEPIAVTVEGGLKMEKPKLKSFNLQEPIPKIIEALHEAHIPIAALDMVFELVKRDITHHTYPYNPNFDSAIFLANSATTDSATEPKG